MHADALESLQKSVTHWTRMATGNRKPGEGCGPYDCDLCKKFWCRGDSDEVVCDGCPVFMKTGKVGCRGTPHDAIELALDAYKDERGTEDGFYDSQEFLEIAGAELSFLKSLLP